MEVVVSEFAPILVVGFNRPLMIRETLTNLMACNEVDKHEIYICVDGPRSKDDAPKVEEVLRTIREVCGRRSLLPKIMQRETNLGGVKNMRRAIDEVLGVHGRVIIIEDDILVSRTFLQYMEAGLRHFQNDRRVWAINGYLDFKFRVPKKWPAGYFFAPRHSAWGWATWKSRWEEVDFDLTDWSEKRKDLSFCGELKKAGGDIVTMLDAQAAGELNAWDVQCTYYMRKNGMYTIRPRMSLTKNNGFGTQCEHCANPALCYSKQEYFDFLPSFGNAVDPDPAMIDVFTNSMSRTVFQRVADRLRRMYVEAFGAEHRYPTSDIS